MGSHATKLVACACALACCLFGAASAVAAPAVTGTFPVASEIGTNNKIVTGPDGNVWLTVESLDKDVARVTPAGQVQEFDIEGIETAVGIAPGPDGNLWVTDVEKAAKFSPGDPEATDKSFTVPGIGADGQIVTGPDGLLWVASGNQLVHFSPADPTGTVQPVAVNGGLSPKDIDVAGNLVAIADAGAENRIVTFTVAGTQKDFTIGGGSQGVSGGPDGQIAFSAPGATPEQSGLIMPPNPAQSFELLGDPFGVTFGDDDAYWIVQFAFGQLARVTPAGQLTTPITGLPLESARQITSGPGGTLWVTLQKNEAKGVAPAVVRISGVEPVLAPPLTPLPGSSSAPGPGTTPPPASLPETTLGKSKKVFKTKGKRASVKFRFSSTDAGASFECALRKKRKGKLTPIKFKGCKSPKTYSLVPGKYVFLVQAVNSAGADRSPAAHPFKVVRVP